jgi:hypothetical protein
VRRAGREELRAGTAASGGRDSGVGGYERAEPAVSGDIPCSVRRASREELRAGPADAVAGPAASGGRGGGVGGYERVDVGQFCFCCLFFFLFLFSVTDSSFGVASAVNCINLRG